MHSSRPFAKAIAWTAISKWSAYFLSWSSTLVVARTLTPSDYGLFGMALVLTGFAKLASEGGFGQAVITIRNVEGQKVRAMNSLAVALGATIGALCCVAAYPTAWFFQAPALVPVIWASSLTFVFAGFTVVQDAWLQRQQRFRLLGAIEIVKVSTQAGTTIVLALLGFSYWSLVVGMVAAAAAEAALVSAAARIGFAAPRIKELKEPLTLSAHVVTSRLSWYVYSNADFAIAGRMLGQAALGSYTFAWSLASLPVEKMTNMVTRVTPSFFADAQKEPDKLKKHFLSATEGIALLTMPASIGLALVAKDLVSVALGPQWPQAVLPLQILSLYIAFRSITTLLPSLLNSTGYSRFVMQCTTAAVVIFPLAFWWAARFGLTGIAVVWLICYPIITVPMYVPAFRAMGLSAKTYLRTLAAPLLSTVAMAAVMLLARLGYAERVTESLRLALDIALGAGAYTAAILLLHRERILQLVRGNKPKESASVAV